MMTWKEWKLVWQEKGEPKQFGRYLCCGWYVNFAMKQPYVFLVGRFELSSDRYSGDVRYSSMPFCSRNAADCISAKSGVASATR